MTVDQIIEGIRNAPLVPEVQERAITEIREKSSALKGMFKSLLFKAPSALEGWYHEITNLAMEIITPKLREANVGEREGTNTYGHIYVSVAGIKGDAQKEYFVE